ncbi:MAG TPA: hypothetical protein VKY81_11320 [Natronosporangium sp.]|nr:hypothetical protein [Natronosporangium sp.]
MNAPRAAGAGLLIAVLATALVIAGCGLFNRSGEDDRFVRPGEPKTSPSGRFTAMVEPGPVQNGAETLIVVITTADGAEVFRDDYAYSTRHGVRVTWLSDRDQLWILSGDVGTSHVEPDSSGVWVKTGITPETVDDIPAEIDALRPVPGR